MLKKWNGNYEEENCFKVLFQMEAYFFFQVRSRFSYFLQWRIQIEVRIIITDIVMGHWRRSQMKPLTSSWANSQTCRPKRNFGKEMWLVSSGTVTWGWGGGEVHSDKLESHSSSWEVFNWNRTNGKGRYWSRWESVGGEILNKRTDAFSMDPTP